MIKAPITLFEIEQAERTCSTYSYQNYIKDRIYAFHHFDGTYLEYIKRVKEIKIKYGYELNGRR